MMNGINVLNTVDVTSFPWWLYTLCGIVIAGFAIGCVCLIVTDDFRCIIIMACAAFLIFVNIKLIDRYEYIDYIKYEVTIDDNVNLKEFNDKYEIIEQRGEIYVIKERTESE